jgi:hypothetical protein
LITGLAGLETGYRGLFPPGVKWPGREANHSPPVSAEVKKVDLYIYSPIRLHGIVLNSLSTGTTLPLPDYVRRKKYIVLNMFNALQNLFIWNNGMSNIRLEIPYGYPF